MPEHFRRATGRPREVTDAGQSPTLDLTTLTDQEEKIIQAVIQKDEIERSILEAKISEVRKEIQEIRKAGALTAGDDQNAICARCKFKFMPAIVPWADHGQRCATCKFRVCARCRTQQAGGAWLCILCFKYRQEKQLTGEFMSKGPPAANPLYGSDLLRASLRDRSRRRSGYEAAEGVNYVRRPAKTRDADSEDEAPAASFSTVHAAEAEQRYLHLSANTSDFFRHLLTGLTFPDWRGKRKLPTLDRVTSLKRENSHQVKWPALRRQDSYSQAIETENIPFGPPKGNTDRRGQWGQDVSSHSLHANADTGPVEFRQKLDSDTSSVASFASDSQHASRTNSVGSSEGSRGMRDANSVHDRNVQTIVVRGNIPAALPSKFRFRRSSSSLTESQRSDSFDSSSSYEQSKEVVGSNSKSPAVSRSSADEESGVKKRWSGGGDCATKTPSNEDNLETVNSSEGNIKSRQASQDSFEEVYNSNANLFVQMMNNEESAKDGGSTKDKLGKQRRRLPQRPGEGKNLHILLQKSVSLSEEMAENARFQSFDEGDKEVLLTAAGKAVKVRSDDILEERLLLPSEIRKRQSTKDSFTSKDSSGPQKQTSRIPIIKKPAHCEEKLTSASAQTKIVPNVMKEESLPKAGSRFGAQVAEASSTNMKEPSQVDRRSLLKKPHQLEVKQRSGVTRILQGRPEDRAVSLSRSGSNVSDARSNVTEESDLHGQAEKYDYASDHSSDDTFHNSSLQGSFSDDDNPDGIITTTLASVDSVKPPKVMPAEMDHSLYRESTSNFDGRSKVTDDNDAFQRTLHEEDHDVKSDDSQLCTDHSGDRASLMSSATEDSNPEGYYQGRESSINHHTSDLDQEDLLHSTLSRESTESYRDAHPESPKVADGDPAGGQRRIENRDVTLASSTDRLSVPSIAVTNTGVEQSGKEDEDEEDDLDELFNNHQPNTLLGSRSSLADSRESIYSVYSDAGEVNYGRISVTGEIMFKLNFNYKSNTLEVHIIQCKELAPVDAKHNRSDPYVKTYLLPDKTRSSKRKTRIKKHTLSPIFDEILKYQLNKTELETRSLWVTVWHNDRFGRNDFLGEVTIPLDYYSYNDNAPQWYPLQERQTATQEPVMSYRGDLFISLKFVTPDMVEGGPKKKSGTLRKKAKEKEKPVSGLGEIYVLVKEAQNLTAMRGSAGSDPFCKGYLLPDESHGSKQKTPVVRKTTSPQWQHTLVFEGVDPCRLPQHGLELTIWDYERLSSNDFLGGVRLNLGQGCHQGKPADWMDARGEEIEAWQSMIDHPNQWVNVQLPLRVSMSKEGTKK